MLFSSRLLVFISMDLWFGWLVLVMGLEVIRLGEKVCLIVSWLLVLFVWNLVFSVISCIWLFMWCYLVSLLFSIWLV